MIAVAASAQVTAPDFSFILLPDTQNEAQYYPQELYQEITWIVNNRSAYNIQAVLGLGDIVNVGTDDTQQANADAAIRQLDAAGIPYLMALGNHDYDSPNTNTRGVTGFNKWWGPARYAGKGYYLGSYPSGSNENSYGVLTINGKPYLFLVLEYNPRDAALDWAASILQANPDKEVIVVTHSFVFLDSTRADVCDTEDVPKDNYAASVWDKLISKYANIVMVVNGHFPGTHGGATRRADLGVNGNLVNQMLSDFQDNQNGGNGWLRIVTFHPAANTIHVTTYSPTIPDTMTDGANNFDVYYHNPGFNTGKGRITGKVRGTPSTGCSLVAGATVTAGSSSAVTDANGYYSVTVPAPATYAVGVQASAYQPTTRSVQVSDNYATQANVYLEQSGLQTSRPCALSPVSPSVTICSPANNATVASPVHLVAGSTDSNTVVRMEAWVDGTKMYTQLSNSLDTNLTLNVGTHRIAVVAAESSGYYFSSVIYITVGPPTAVTVSLTASPTTIASGQSSTLTWSSANATSVSIAPGVGTFAASGTVTVSPAATTTYIATATGAGGTATTSATVTVQSTSTAPTVTLTANPTFISAGQSSTLSWTSTNAISVSISPGGGTYGPSGTLTVTPSATTTYTASAVGSSGSATGSATVTVQTSTATCTLSTLNHTITICTPGSGQTVTSPVHVVAGSTDTTGSVVRMEVWVDGVKIYTQSGNSLNASLPLAGGTHRLVVVAAESSTSYFSEAIYITVGP